MFDTYVSRSVSERVTENVHVTEKRAPTDESVRLLREMEAEARAEVLKSVRVNNAMIEVVLHYRRDVLSAQTQYVIVYKVNGQREVARYDCDEMALESSRGEQMDKLVDGLIGALAESIACKLLAGLRRQVAESLGAAT